MMDKEECIIGRKYRVTVAVICCGEWLDETSTFTGQYKGNGSFEDKNGHHYNSSVIRVKEVR